MPFRIGLQLARHRSRKLKMDLSLLYKERYYAVEIR